MNHLLQELSNGLPEPDQIASLGVRLTLALSLGAVVGLQRERLGKPAGLRTHMLVAFGAALFVLAPLQAGVDLDGLARVIQGLVAGIGFLGAGAILKLQDRREIEGLTTAAGIWMTAAVGVAVGLGRLGLAVVATLLTWITLALVNKLEVRAHRQQRMGANDAMARKRKE